MESSKDISITSGGKERLTQAVNTLAPEFVDDPIITWLMHDLPQNKKDAHYNLFFQVMLKAASLNSGSFLEARDWGACLVLMPPGEKRMLFEYTKATESAKKRALKGVTKFYYVFFVATRSDARRQGLCSALIRHCQSLAAAEGCPLWLEATTEKSRDLYLKEGFAITEELRIGKGCVDTNGKTKRKGEGVTIWAMIWRP